MSSTGPTRWSAALRLVAALGTLALVAAACSDAASSSIGGSASLGPVLAEDPFYDEASGQVVGDARLVSSQPLADFDVPDGGSSLAAESVTPIGASGDLEVATWFIEDEELGTLDCIGFRIGSSSSGSTCGESPAAAEEVSFQVACVEGEPPEWRAFTVADGVIALRLEVEGDLPAIGDDPNGTGLVAVEATGTVSRLTAQTASGEVRLIEVDLDCPPG